MSHLFRLVGLAACLLAGCLVGPVPRYRIRSSPPAEPPLTSEEILRMSKAGISDGIILEKIKADGIAVRPTAEQIVSLKKDGLSDLVIQSMVTARVPDSTATVLEETHQAYPHDTYFYPYDDPWGYRDVYWYPWPHYGWWFWCYPNRYRTWHYSGPGPTIRRYRP